MSPSLEKAMAFNKGERSLSLLSDLLPDSYFVNSYHHQAVKDLSPLLKAIAFSNDGLIEAVQSKDNMHKILGVQLRVERQAHDLIRKTIKIHSQRNRINAVQMNLHDEKVPDAIGHQGFCAYYLYRLFDFFVNEF